MRLVKLIAKISAESTAQATGGLVLLQAGVAMGLAKTVATRFPTWGPEFATLMVSALINPSSEQQRPKCTLVACTLKESYASPNPLGISI